MKNHRLRFVLLTVFVALNIEGWAVVALANPTGRPVLPSEQPAPVTGDPDVPIGSSNNPMELSRAPFRAIFAAMTSGTLRALLAHPASGLRVSIRRIGVSGEPRCLAQ